MLTIDISVSSDWPGGVGAYQLLAERASIAALQHSYFEAHLGTAGQFELSIQLVDNAAVHDLNREWRGKDKPTNVLSFPMLDAQGLADLAKHASSNDGPEILLGDIILAYQTCAAEADEKNISVQHHMQHLVVHGTLHLLGYDHDEDSTALAMESLEIEILASLGISDPYAMQIGAP